MSTAGPANLSWPPVLCSAGACSEILEPNTRSGTIKVESQPLQRGKIRCHAVAQETSASADFVKKLLFLIHSSIRATSATFSSCAVAHGIIAFNQTFEPVPFSFKGFPPPVQAQHQEQNGPTNVQQLVLYIYN